MAAESTENEQYPYRNPERLHDLYHGNKLTVEEVAEELGACPKTIIKWLDHHGIERRSTSEAMELAWRRGCRDHPAADREYRDEELLRELYVEEGVSTTDLADRLECTPKALRRALEDFDIERRPAGQTPIRKSILLRTLLEADDPVLSSSEICERAEISSRNSANNHLQELAEELGVVCRKDAGGSYVYWLPESPPTETPWRDGDLLRRLYLEEELPTTTIGDVLGCSSKTISNWLCRHEIPTRPSASEAASKR